MVIHRGPSQSPLTRMPHLSANKGGSEMIPGAVHRSPGIYLKAEENPGKPQPGELFILP